MPVSFDIASASGSYRVTVGSSLLADILLTHADAIILIDKRLAHVLPADAARVIRIAATEDNKSLEQSAPIITGLRELGANRRTHLLAIGGGIIQDISAFAASIYMRGIPWSYLPTTLLGMVDSCIGGKSSINVYGYKNLIGNFYPPAEIVIDLDFLKSLNVDQMIGGLCEAAKICYARSVDEFGAYLADEPAINMTPAQAQRIVTRSLRAKQWFIEIDEFDQKERLLLNFGHTFGHALEAGTEFRITHGVAVGFGMVVAEEFARQHSLMSAKGAENSARLTSYVEALLNQMPVLADELRALDIGLITEKFDNDKKHHADQYRIVVPSKDGKLTLLGIPRTEKGRSDIRKAYIAAIERLSKTQYVETSVGTLHDHAL